MSERGRLLGIDHGAKMMGLAICDTVWIAARPLGILKRTTRAADFETIRDLIDEHHIVGIVLGMPAMPDDFDGVSQADTVHRWATRLAAAVDVPVYLWDEGLSSYEADVLAEEAGAAPVERNDDRAAAVILQTFIDAHARGEPLPPPVKLKAT